MASASPPRRSITDRYPEGRTPITPTERAFWRIVFAVAVCASATVAVSLGLTIARAVLS